MKKYVPYFVMLSLILALLFSIQRCNYNKQLWATSATAVTDTVAYFKNTMGGQTASIKTLEVNNRQLQALVTGKDSRLAAMAQEFSNVHTVIKYKNIISVDTVYAAYSLPLDTLPHFERSGAVFNEWYNFEYKVNNSGLKLSNLSMRTETAVITGIKRKWFLGKETLTTDITNTNPYVSITTVKAAEVIVPEPWYKKWYLWLAAGIAGGFVLSK